LSSPISVTRDTLVVLALANSPHNNENFDFFTFAGVPPADSRYFIQIIHNGEPHPATRARLACLAEHPHIEFVIRENDIDMCAYRRGLLDPQLYHHKTDPAQFRRYLLLNGSVRGPFLRNSDRVNSWPEIFFRMLDDETALAGTTINPLEGHRKVHLQSMLLAMDQRALPTFLALTARCETFSELGLSFQEIRTWAIHSVEHTFTRAIIDQGYNVASTQVAWFGHDFRNATATAQRTPFWETDPQHPGDYYGLSGNLFEWVFMKTNRHLSPQALQTYSDWIRAQKQPAFLQFCAERHLEIPLLSPGKSSTSKWAAILAVIVATLLLLVALIRRFSPPVTSRHRSFLH
jgi:hypothetical protein